MKKDGSDRSPHVSEEDKNRPKSGSVDRKSVNLEQQNGDVFEVYPCGVGNVHEERHFDDGSQRPR